MSMYPGWTGDDSYWSQQAGSKPPYDPLLYNQNYMNNMKNMLAAQWADQPNPWVYLEKLVGSWSAGVLQRFQKAHGEIFRSQKDNLKSIL